MKTPFRLSVVASLVAALCIAPTAFAKPKNSPQGGGGGGKHGKGGQAAGVASVEPGGAQPGAGGPGIVVVPPPLPPPPPPYYHRSYHRSSESSDSTVLTVQSALKTRGYYTGSLDGVAGSGTRAAIRGFREDNGLEVSSRIDAPLLRALGL